MQVSVKLPHGSAIPHLQVPESQVSVDPPHSSSDWHCPLNEKIGISLTKKFKLVFNHLKLHASQISM